MNIRIYGGGLEVGRVALGIRSGEREVVLDYGVNFDENDKPKLPLQPDPKSLKGFIISHAHLDHIGALPLYQISNRFDVYGTSFTRKVSELMLNDFIKISGAYLPFEHLEVRKTLRNFIEVEYDTEFDIDKFKVKLVDAGHIPGSASILVDDGKFKVLYTGDTNTASTKLVSPTKLLNGISADILMIESTYGKFNHSPRDKVEERFIQSVREVIEGGGTVLVPAFSLARSQEILSILAERNVSFNVYYDGMVREILNLMLQNREFLNRVDLLEKVRNNFHYVKGWQDRNRIWNEPCVIIASAGMLKGGPAVFYFEKLASSEKNGVFLVSYQADNSPGRKLITVGKINGESQVKARVELFDFSSHAGKDELIKIVKSVKGLSKVIVVHGNEENSKYLSFAIRESTGIESIAINNGSEITL
jgi:putative mRNA 3-end processing factor